ncbi:hypothetical protein N0V90_002966 [Kalmusia sp. IMI 367209]|nr:hypothetical protein N0V90_002966 [Kalmusia sp. IMI 367209]
MGGRTKRPRPHTTRPKAFKPKTKNKPKSKLKPKPKQKPTHTKSKPKHKKPTKPNRTPGKHTRTSAAAKATSTKTCKQLYQQQLREVSAADRASRRVSRDIFALEKRSTRKYAKACSVNKPAVAEKGYDDKAEVNVRALDYPNKKDMDKLQGMLKANIDPKDYQVEHVLEWQTVTNFFTWVRDKKITDLRFQDPKTQKKVDFCKFWKETWVLTKSESFSIVSGGPERTAGDHLKWGFPGLQNRPYEFTFVHKTINGIKAQMWAYKSGSMGSGIFGVDKMTTRIAGKHTSRTTKPKSLDEAKSAYLDLRALMGARKYMRSSKIAKTLGKEVKEMEKVIRRIDESLPKHPRPGEGAWVKQDLGKLWMEYMDERFRLAHDRTTKDLDKYIKLMHTTWNNAGRGHRKRSSPDRGRSKDKGKAPVKRSSRHSSKFSSRSSSTNSEEAQIRVFLQEVRKLEAEWKKEKNIEWRRPW